MKHVMNLPLKRHLAVLQVLPAEAVNADFKNVSGKASYSEFT